MSEKDEVRIEDKALAQGFTQMPNSILRNKNISQGAKVTYAVLLSYAWQKDSCFAGQDQLAEDMGVNKKTALRQIQELKDKKLIEVKRRGLGLTNVYIIKEVTNVGNQEVAQTRSDKCGTSEVTNVGNQNTQKCHFKNGQKQLTKNIQVNNTQNQDSEEEDAMGASSQNSDAQTTAFSQNAAKNDKNTQEIPKKHPQSTKKTRKPSTSPPKKKSEEPPQLSDGAQAVLAAWQTLRKVKIQVGEKTREAAEFLAENEVTQPSKLKDIENFCYTSNRDWYGAHGVNLCDIAKNLEKYVSLLERHGHSITDNPPTPPEPPPTRSTPMPPIVEAPEDDEYDDSWEHAPETLEDLEQQRAILETLVFQGRNPAMLVHNKNKLEEVKQKIAERTRLDLSAYRAEPRKAVAL